MMKGELLWQGKPSPLAYTKTYLLCALTSWLGFPLWLAFRKYRQTRTTLYEVSTCSVSEYHALDPSRNRLLELDRIRDVEVNCSTPYRLFQLCDLIIHPARENLPPIVFRAISNAHEVRDKIQGMLQETHKERQIQDIRLPILQG
jgi:hypothetical protein